MVLIMICFSADGNYEVTIMTKAILHYTGRVRWNPPAIYKSYCGIDVEYFPFDEQECMMKFGSWTYDGFMVRRPEKLGKISNFVFQLDLRHMNQLPSNNSIGVAMDLRDFYISTEWDVMEVPAQRNEKYYPCCEEPYYDIIFYMALRRKSLFYTVNVIIPCVGISFLSVLVFHLPSDSGEKVSLSISILLSLTVFFLLLAEIIPPTSMSVPLLGKSAVCLPSLLTELRHDSFSGKYLLFTMILVTFSVVVTIGVLNVNFRTPATHKVIGSSNVVSNAGSFHFISAFRWHPGSRKRLLKFFQSFFSFKDPSRWKNQVLSILSRCHQSNCLSMMTMTWKKRSLRIIRNILVCISSLAL